MKLLNHQQKVYDLVTRRNKDIPMTVTFNWFRGSGASFTLAEILKVENPDLILAIDNSALRSVSGIDFKNLKPNIKKFDFNGSRGLNYKNVILVSQHAPDYMTREYMEELIRDYNISLIVNVESTNINSDRYRFLLKSFDYVDTLSYSDEYNYSVKRDFIEDMRKNQQNVFCSEYALLDKRGVEDLISEIEYKLTSGANINYGDMLNRVKLLKELKSLKEN